MWSSVENGSSAGGVAPCSRGKHSATLLGGHVYVLGGRGAGGAVPLRDFWKYSLADGRWERLDLRGDPPPALLEHSVTAHENKLYVFGGEAGSSNETPLWIYDTDTKLWRKVAGQSSVSSCARRRGVRGARGPAGAGAGAGAGPRGRRGHSAHALKDCLLVYGGYKDLRGSTNELWAFHYESCSWQAVRTAGAGAGAGAGPARHRHAAALHDTRLYVHAGQCDLREAGDLWHYDTISRVWTQVKTPAKCSPSPRSGHAAVRAGPHLYIFGGESAGHPTNELWRFHFASETWERMIQGVHWPSPRVDCSVVLVSTPPPAHRPRAPRPAAAAPRPDPPASLLREISKLSGFHLRRSTRCSYSMLGEQDSTESLVPAAPLAKSHSSYIMDGPREGDVAVRTRADMSREPISVPDFADMVLPTPVLSPTEATKLVYLDSDEEEDLRREMVSIKRQQTETVVAIPKSASVRFTRDVKSSEDEGEMSTSDYASAERVNRLSGTSSLGFSNPHYLGPDVRTLGAALTPDSGLGPGDIELQDLGEKKVKGVLKNGSPQLHLLLVGGKEPPHLALFQSPLSMWTYRLL